MKAAKLYGTRDLRIEEVEKPVPKEDEVLIKVGGCGICGSDLYMYKGGRWGPSLSTGLTSGPVRGVVLGHEAAGVVTEVGSKVGSLHNKGIEVGDRVAPIPNHHCRQCVPCQRGLFQYCENMWVYGINRDGGFAEYMTALWYDCIKLPPNVTDEEGTFMEPAGLCYVSVEVSGVRPGQSCAVFGTGREGLVIMQIARAFGARPVIAIEPVKERREKAKMLGADIVVDPATEDPVKRILEETQGLGVDVAINASNVREGYLAQQMIDSLCISGKAMMFGGTQDIPPASWKKLCDKQIFVLPTREMTTISQSWFQGYQAVRMMQTGLLNVKDTISHRLPVDEVEHGFELMEKRPKGYIKAVIIP